MNKLKDIFLKGLIAILPIILTLAIIGWAAIGTEKLVGNIFKAVIPGQFYVPGLGILLLIGLTFVAGLVIDLYFFNSIVSLFDKLIARIPLVKTLYSGIRDFMRYISMASRAGDMSQVVMVKVGGNLRLIGFITNKQETLGDEAYVAVYIPLSFQIGGYTLYLKEGEYEVLDISPEIAMRKVLTGSVPAIGGAAQGSR